MEKKKSKSTLSVVGAQNEQTNSVEDVKKNPLDIPEIVAIVVGNIVKVEDLKTIRALNKQWRDESLKKWRSSAVFVINEQSKLVLVKAFDDSVLTGLGKEEEDKDLAKMDPFILREIPFKNYRFQGVLATTSDFEQDLIFKKIIAPYADYLDLGDFLLTGSREFDAFERIFNYNLRATDLVLTPLWRNDDYFKGWRNGKFNKEVDRRERIYPPPAMAPTVLQLTLLIPSQGRQRELLQEHGLKPLFVPRGTVIDYKYNNQKMNILRWFVLKRMPNLKGIHFSSSYALEDALSEMILASRRGQCFPKLEVIDMPLYKESGYLLELFFDYVTAARPPLRKIKAVAPWFECSQEDCTFLLVLRYVEETLTDLELEVDCKCRWSALPASIPEEEFFVNARHFLNLTRFKVVMDYPYGAKGKFLSFDLNHLRKMPKLKEFFFGFKNPGEYIPERVISTKLEISEEPPSCENEGISEGNHFDLVLGEEVDGDGLKHLKSFHLHRNLTKSALQIFGKWTKNLQTLEGIFDEENFPTVRETWPSLQTLKLLQGSSVPEEFLVSKSAVNVGNELNVVRLESSLPTSAMRKRSVKKIVKKAV